MCTEQLSLATIAVYTKRIVLISTKAIKVVAPFITFPLLNKRFHQLSP